MLQVLMSMIWLLVRLGLKSHVEKEASSSEPNPEWCKLDDLIKMWILGLLCDSLQEHVVSTPGNAKALWDHIQGLFHDNKDARAIALDNELRSIKIGTMSINEYCTKIKSLADRLKNLGSVVSDKNLVTYAVNGLDSRYQTIVKIIRHREPLPSFETARSMLLLDESTMNEEAGASSIFDSNSSSPTVLVTTNSSGSKDNPNTSSNESPSLTQLCNHFNKGSCKFGDRCKFIHDHRKRSGLQSRNHNGRHTVNNTLGQNNASWYPPGYYNNRITQQHQQPTPRLGQHPNPHAFTAQQHYPQPITTPQVQYNTAAQAHYPLMAQQIHQQPVYTTPQPGQTNGILGLAPGINGGMRLRKLSFFEMKLEMRFETCLMTCH
ncbi:hybrid signal transduction histidine kinase M [Artemisia annua]|uniref:Hybrid signal transduction histidine kinase M n=1 Tax=Artemisia annua TaxID=35608 RepID=A0A2U1NAS0_ARTAN|nr:hybrid signal transduction histidine kinase M [Artemisia annua]